MKKSFKKNLLKFIIISIVTLSTVLYFYLPSYNNSKTLLTSNNNNVIIHYIDIGQGDAILIQKKNTNILIDTGPGASKTKLIKYLKKYMVKKIDALIITHPHEDHLGGATKVLNKFKVSNIYCPNVTTNTPTYMDFIDTIRKKNMQINYLRAGDNLDISSLKLEILSPFNNNYDNLNDYSLVINISYGNYNLLFTGDMEKTEESEFMSYYKNLDKKKTVLKVPHHGSSTTCSDDFLSLTKPSISIISCGINNSFGHPHKPTLARLKKINSIILRTDLDGSIVLICDGYTVKKVENN